METYSIDEAFRAVRWSLCNRAAGGMGSLAAPTDSNGKKGAAREWSRPERAGYASGGRASLPVSAS
jgi:hypothetical protein